MTGYQMPAIPERVDAGEAALFRDNQVWWRADADRPINLERLDMADDYDCLLGQACPPGLGARDFTPAISYAAHLAGCHPWVDGAVNAWMITHGFMVPRFADDRDAEYAELTAEWHQRVTRRRNRA